jgi:hypothetical protein
MRLVTSKLQILLQNVCHWRLVSNGVIGVHIRTPQVLVLDSVEIGASSALIVQWLLIVATTDKLTLSQWISAHQPRTQTLARPRHPSGTNCRVQTYRVLVDGDGREMAAQGHHDLGA